MNIEFEDCDITDEHTRTIIHIDIDCFYAQVEMNKNPDLRTKPLGIQQKSIIVTCNYVARERNVRKVMPINEALKICPDLVLVNGEDLYEYRKVSNHLNDLIAKNYSNLIEKMGFDECYIDVTKLVSRHVNDAKFCEAIGTVFNDNYEPCQCGCDARLKIGSRIAQEIRDQLRKDLNLTSSAGISYNKLLAKLCGSYRKPNDQTVLFASNVSKFMDNLEMRKIPGIGDKIYENLARNNILGVRDLQNVRLDNLKKILGNEVAKRISDFSFGKDNSQVKIQERPQSISLEESFFSTSNSAEIEKKFHDFLRRIMVLINEDGRVPNLIRISVRKCDRNTTLMNREQKQTHISISQIFDYKDEIIFTKNGQQKLMMIIMDLFAKVVNTKKPFKVNLLGLTFTKLQSISCLKNNLLKSFVNKKSTSSENRDTDNDNDNDDDIEIIKVTKRSISPRVSAVKKKPLNNTIDNYFCKKQTK